MPSLRALAICCAAVAAPVPALAVDYPITGYWTYNYSAEEGPARQCDGRRMEFAGERRFDTAGGVRDFRIVSVMPAGASLYRIVDEIFTGQVRGHVDYTLRMIDADHIELRFASGTNVLLRRCA